MTDIFCQIINKEVPADFVYEDNDFVVFRDINPKAPIHLLVVSRRHIASVNDLKNNDKDLIGQMILVAKKVALDQKLNSGYKLVFNVGRGGGQIVPHLHLHLLGGWSKETHRVDI